jgi:hypothetical protein
LHEVWKVDGFLIDLSGLLRFEVFEEYGSLAGDIVFIFGVENAVKERLEGSYR